MQVVGEGEGEGENRGERKIVIGEEDETARIGQEGKGRGRQGSCY